MNSPFTNSLKKKLKSKERTAGTWIHLGSPTVTEILSLAGFDWLLIDMEHGFGDYQTLLSQLHALQGGPATPIVRVQWNDHAIIKRVMDMGVHSIMIPSINNRSECEAAIRACKYPPEGIRGIGPIRAARYGDISDYLKQANHEVLTIIQIETAEGVAQIDDILQIPGIDVVFIGPNDLAASLGHLNDLKHPNVVAAIEKIETAVKSSPASLATLSSNWSEAKQLYQRGYQMLTLCSDVSLLMNSANELITHFRNQ